MTVLVGIGIGLLAIGGYLLIDAVFLIRRCNETATGTLVAIEERDAYEFRNGKKRCFVPVYEYEANGRKYKNAAKIFRNSPEYYEIGSTTEVKYCATNPDVCIITNRNGKVGCGIILIGIGIFLCVI